MNSRSQVDWQIIRSRAALFSEDAFEFVREGLKHTVQGVHGPGPCGAAGGGAGPGEPVDERRHVSGQQLCLGLRDLAISRYGLLAQCVLARWGILRTDDFGTIVYAMIDRGELRASDRDSIDDFRAVYDFQETLGNLVLA